MIRTLRNAALAAALMAGALNPVASLAANAPAAAAKTGGAVTSDQLRSGFNDLSPETRAILLKKLRSTSPADLSKMTPDQMQDSFNSLPPAVQAQLRAKWDGLTDEQKASLKKMNPAVLKDMFGHEVKQQVTEILKPVQGVIDAGVSIAQKARSEVQKAKGYVRNLFSKLFG